MFGRHKYCLSRNAVHVNTDASLEVVQVNEPIFGDQVDNSVSFGNLHCDRKIIYGLWREIDVYSFFGEDGVGRVVINFDNVQLQKGLSANGYTYVTSLTFAPVAVRTEKVKRLVGPGAPSRVISAKAAACPSIDWLTFRSRENN